MRQEQHPPTRQILRAMLRDFANAEAVEQREEARAAKRKERGIVGGSRARQFTPLDLTIEKVFKATMGAAQRGIRSRTGFIKLARRLYHGDKIDRPWRSYPREPAIQIDGRIVL